MSTAVVKKALRRHLADNWDTTTANIRDSNTAFDPQGLPWIELRFPGAAISRGDIGEATAPLWDEVGAFMVDVYVPQGGDIEAADEIADAVWDLFKGAEIDGIRCDSRLAGQSGPRTPAALAGAWWGTSFGIAYRFLSVG